MFTRPLHAKILLILGLKMVNPIQGLTQCPATSAQNPRLTSMLLRGQLGRQPPRTKHPVNQYLVPNAL